PAGSLSNNTRQKKLRYEKDEDKKELERFAMRSNELRLMAEREAKVQQPLETDIQEEVSFTIEEFEEAATKSAPLPYVNLDCLKKWIKENYTHKIETTLSNLRATMEIERLDLEQFNFVSVKDVEEYDIEELIAYLRTKFSNLSEDFIKLHDQNIDG
ncbi:10300_t:CDS:2, partial [Funneliformis caledonium]